MLLGSDSNVDFTGRGSLMGFLDFIHPSFLSFHVPMISHAGILKKIFLLFFPKCHVVFLLCTQGEFVLWGGLAKSFADKRSVLPDFQRNANVQMISLPVTPSACGGSSFIDYNELHVWGFGTLTAMKMNNCLFLPLFLLLFMLQMFSSNFCDCLKPLISLTAELLWIEATGTFIPGVAAAAAAYHENIFWVPHLHAEKTFCYSFIWNTQSGALRLWL